MSLDHLKRPKPEAKPTAQKVLGERIPPKGGSSTAKPAKPTNKIVKEVEGVVFRCGHGCSAGLFKGRDCPQCEFKRDKDKRAKKARQRERQGNRRSDALNDFRFPKGTRVELFWDGEKWGGLAVCPVFEPEAKVVQLTSTDTGVERLLRKLKDLFIAQTTPKPEETPADPGQVSG